MFVGPQGDFMGKVSNYVARLWWSDEDINTISLLFQDSLHWLFEFRLYM